MKVQFPHAGGYEIAAEDFLRSWVEFYSKKKSKFKFDEPIPCLASAATLNDLKEKKHDFGVDYFCRTQVPKQYADTMQATNQFFDLNKKLFQICEAINPISGRAVKAVKLSAFARKLHNSFSLSKTTSTKKVSPEKSEMTMQKFVYVRASTPLLAVYKSQLEPNKQNFKLLSLMGFADWQNELELATEGETSVSFFSGVGPMDSDTFDKINGVMFGEHAVIIGDDIYIEGGICRIENVRGYLFSNNENGEWTAKCKLEQDYIEIKFSKSDIKTINNVLEEREMDILFDMDEDDREFLAFQGNRKESLEKLSSSDGTNFTYNWDDLDDFEVLSHVWSFSLRMKS